jgi:hypothetical protein
MSAQQVAKTPHRPQHTPSDEFNLTCIVSTRGGLKRRCMVAQAAKAVGTANYGAPARVNSLPAAYPSDRCASQSRSSSFNAAT